MNLPNTFEEKMKHLLGEEYEDYLKCYEEPRHYGLRVNINKISVEDFLKIAPWPLRPVPWIDLTAKSTQIPDDSLPDFAGSDDAHCKIMQFSSLDSRQ